MVQFEDDVQPDPLAKQSLLSKYNIPVHFLDYSYVEKCTNGRELEKIYHILKSGEEGYFPDLTLKTEQRLANIKPNSKFLKKVTPVLTKNDITKEEWNTLSYEINDWLHETHENDEELESRKKTAHTSSSMPDVRPTRTHGVSAQEPKSNAKRIASTDYASWAKYDVDTEMLKMDLEDEKLKKDVVKQQIETKNDTKIKLGKYSTFAEKKFEANRRKEKGNDHFKAEEYNDAITEYTCSLEYQPNPLVYTNRALAYIKIKRYQDAILDCKSAINLDPQNIKAYIRMAQSLEAIKHYNEALESAEKAVQIDPNNETAQNFANRLNKLAGNKTKSKRFFVEDVAQNNSSNKQITKTTQNKVNNQLNEMIAIPGSSKMSPPYYATKQNYQQEIIKREKQKIFNRLNALYLSTTDDNSDDDDCCTDHFEQIRNTINVKHKKTKESTNNQIKDEERTNNGNQVDSKSRKQFEINIKNPQPVMTTNECKRLPKHITEMNKLTIPNKLASETTVQTPNDHAGGGESYLMQQQRAEITVELNSSFSFIRTWNSIRDNTYKQHAKVLKNINMERISEVIGYNMDDKIFTDIIKCLHRQFMVVNEVDTVYEILVNMTRIPRFQIMLMFLTQTERTYIANLIDFLNQHDKSLPDGVKNVYL